MPATIPSSEPTELTAGDSWQWDRTYSDYPSSDGWTLKYALTGAHPTVIPLTAAPSADGASFEIRVLPAATKDYTPGRYDLIGYVTDGADRHQVYSGPLFVHPDPAAASPELSFAERMLTELETKIADRLAADISSYTLEQQEVQREELARLQAQRNSYADAVRRERGRAFLQSVKVSFGQPS